jgi:hypothetical protein
LDRYNDVKRIRRLLEAEAGPQDGAMISSEAYSRLMSDLCVQQLAFESLADVAPILANNANSLKTIVVKNRQDTADLKGLYGEVERALDRIVEEYQKRWHVVRDKATLDLGRDLGEPEPDWGLSPFIYKTAQFQRRVKDPVDAVLLAYETYLLDPPRRAARRGRRPSPAGHVAGQ